MILELECIKNQKRYDRPNFYDIVFGWGLCVVKLTLKENLAKNYRVGEIYRIKISNNEKEVIA